MDLTNLARRTSRYWCALVCVCVCVCVCMCACALARGRSARALLSVPTSAAQVDTADVDKDGRVSLEDFRRMLDYGTEKAADPLTKMAARATAGGDGSPAVVAARSTRGGGGGGGGGGPATRDEEDESGGD